MKIIMVIERYLPIWGGAENQLHQLIPHLINKGCRVVVVTRRWHRSLPKSEYVGSVRVIRLGIPGRGLIATLIFTTALVLHIFRDRKDIDIIHSHGAVKTGALCAVMARTCKGMKNIAKIATAGKLTELRRTVFGPLILKLFNMSDSIIAMTGEIRKELLDAQTPVGAIAEITNGVDTDRFSSQPKAEKERFLAEHGLEPDTQLVLFSGRLVQRKGLDVLLAAWPGVVALVPRAYLLILGSGADQEDSVEGDAKDYVNTNKTPRVTFLGESSHPELFLGISDCFAFPSRIEGFPNAMMEAMSSGVPVVASDIGGVLPLVTHGVTGMLFASENHEDLRDKLAEILNTQILRKKIANNSRMLMVENYSFKKISDKYYRLYQSVLSEEVRR